MILTDTGRLLTYLHQFGGKEPSELMALAWHDLLEDVDYDQAKSVVQDLVRAGTKWIEVGDIIKGVDELNRGAVFDIEADVRVAKLKGIVSEDWPKSEPLSLPDAERLRLAREHDMAELRRMAGLDAPIYGAAQPPINPGTIGKEIPNA